MTKALVPNNALELAAFTLENGQVINAETTRNFLVRGNGEVTDQEVLFFLELCKSRNLNPLQNEAYLIKFGSQPAQMIVGKDVFMKRADANIHFEGFRAGVIVERDGEMIEIEGTARPKKGILIGGWCEVHRDDRKFPIKSTVSFDEYNKSQAT